MRISSQIGIYTSTVGMVLSGIGTVMGIISISELILLESMFIAAIFALAD